MIVKIKIKWFCLSLRPRFFAFSILNIQKVKFYTIFFINYNLIFIFSNLLKFIIKIIRMEGNRSQHENAFNFKVYKTEEFLDDLIEEPAIEVNM